LTKTLFSSAVWIGAGCASLLALPSTAQAVTLAGSETTFQFTNFSIRPFEAGTSTVTNSLAVSADGVVQAEATAVSIFQLSPDPISAENFVSNLTFGQGTDYLGVAEGTAALVGNFRLNKGDVFSFDFQGSTQLISAIERPLFESSQAIGGINFSVSVLQPDGGSGIVRDSFSALAVLNTPGQDFFDYQSTGGIKLTEVAFDKTPEGNQEGLFAFFQGTFRHQHQGENPVQFQLSEAKFGAAQVSSSPTPIPEPLTILGSVLAVGMGGWLRKQYLQKDETAV
jgi:hypothetical protein